jgi:hypothetical protein
MRKRLTLVLFGIATLAAGACGSGSHQIRPSSPFTPELARVFDDSVDYVTDVAGLGGRVASDWEHQIDTLSQDSDLIGVAQIETVVQGQDADGSRSYRLTANVPNIVHGEAPEDRHVQLRVSEGQTGFNTVDGREARLEAGRYVLFAKWYVDGEGTVRAHWHLSPYSDALLARVRHSSGAEEATEGQERVVRQEGSSAPPP